MVVRIMISKAQRCLSLAQRNDQQHRYKPDCKQITAVERMNIGKLEYLMKCFPKSFLRMLFVRFDIPRAATCTIPLNLSIRFGLSIQEIAVR